jgi:hypothetical protein
VSFLVSAYNGIVALSCVENGYLSFVRGVKLFESCAFGSFGSC